MASKVVNRLRVLRAEKKMSQAQLAEAAGVSRQAINTIENGHHDPGITLAYRISTVLGAEITEAFPYVEETGDSK